MTTDEVVISDERGGRVCTSRLTCLLSDRVPGAGSAMGLLPGGDGETPPGNGEPAGS